MTFNDILPCVRQSVSELQDQGVNKIIALGHSGYSFSQQVAEIPGVDIVIDGHSHTFLYTGKYINATKYRIYVNMENTYIY